MPRLFVSHRQQPSSATTTPNLTPVPVKAATPRALVVPQLAHQQPIAPVPIAMPTPSPPPAVLVPRPAQQPPTDDAASPLVLVPPVPPTLARLMDSHDLDNPYLVAAFNVLIENKNNPMRVPDILQAVQRKGWTQVLHRHKDRPEQLFGNALRSHQRRREMMNKSSLVFMIDAGSCWKHHQLDLSAASGRKKGKIWCFSRAAGFSCPYARLGLDLEFVIRAQAAGEGGAPGGAADDDDDEEPVAPPKPTKAAAAAAASSSSQEPARKKRRLAASSHIAKPSVLLDPAVRGGVTSAQPVVSRVEPPPYIPAAIRGQEASTVARAALPVEIVPRPAKQTRATRAAAAARAIEELQVQQEEEVEVDLGALTAMSPEPETMMMVVDDDDDLVPPPMMMMITAEEQPSLAPPTTTSADLEEELAPMEIHEELASALAALASPIVDFLPPGTPIVDPHLAENGEASDDDEDDFHVTMNDFPIESQPQQSDFMLLASSSTVEAPSPDSSDSTATSASSVLLRTPTPPPQETARSIAMWSLQTAAQSSDAAAAYDAFHQPAVVGLGFEYDLGGWDNPPTIIHVKSEPVDEPQGPWSRAGSTFGSYSVDMNREAHHADDDLEVAASPLSFVMEPMEMDNLPLPGSASVFSSGGRSSPSVCSARSREGSLLSVRMESRRGSLAPSHLSLSMSMARSSSRPASRMHSPRITPLPDLPHVPELDHASTASPASGLRRSSSIMSLGAALSRPASPHPLILYSPSLGPSSVGSFDAPFKNGLAHRYLVDMHPEDDEEQHEGEGEGEGVEVTLAEDELDGLLNLDGGDVVEPSKLSLPSPAAISITGGLTVSSPIGIKRPRSPSI